jgi:hypothetical protein
MNHSSARYNSELSGMSLAERWFNLSDLKAFQEATSSKSETQTHRILSAHPILFEPLMERVGHHGMWYVSKPQIRPPLTNGKRGKIPDFLLAGRGSGGLEWFIVELKSPADTLFKRNRKEFSQQANAGLNQLAQYCIYGKKCQGAIRDALEIREFENPKGILLIGTDNETADDPDLAELK